MKNWWTHISCFLTGWNYSILKNCTEASKKQLKKYSSALLILIFLWAFIGYSFAIRYIHASTWGAVATAVIFVVVVVQIERQIILTVGANRFLALFRIIIAFIMAFIGSAILDQIIFKDDIEKKMIEIVDRQVNEQLPARLNVINAKLTELQVEIDSLDTRTIALYDEISKRPTINTVSSSVTHVPVTKADGSISTVAQRTVTNTPVENPKMREAEMNKQNLDALRKQQEEYTQRKLNEETLLRKELSSKQGFLEELNAILEILGEKPVALIFYLVLFLFLMSLELFVVFSKIGDKKCDYDLVVEHQLKQKMRTLNELGKT
ncbi:MAG: DUF4407 domain-containing protein [Paludibacteraceae bacterium]